MTKHSGAVYGNQDYHGPLTEGIEMPGDKVSEVVVGEGRTAFCGSVGGWVDRDGGAVRVGWNIGLGGADEKNRDKVKN